MLKIRTRPKAGSFTRIGFLLAALLSPVVIGQVSERATPARDEYVGSQTCAQCHAGIYKQFSATHMGRSLAPVSPAVLDTLGAPLASLPALTYDARMDRHFEASTHDGKLYQSEYQTAPDGKEIFRDTREIKWIIGSGMNGFGGIVERDGYLFQGPLSFYSKANHWAVSPGYEFVDFGLHLLPQRAAQADRRDQWALCGSAFCRDRHRMRKLPWSRREARPGDEASGARGEWLPVHRQPGAPQHRTGQ
jgi:hypothetical protein